MDATPLLVEVAGHLRESRLEAVLIGNAGAALQGAPVTTVDFDLILEKAREEASRPPGKARRRTPRK